MKHNKHSLTFLAGQHIVHLFTEYLSTDLLFHNFHHTAHVVQGVRAICKHANIHKGKKEILLLAAWFHDSGFIRCYEGHEVESQNLAREFLEKHEYPESKIEQVLGCIAATKMPQTPKGVLEQIMCDADLFHLSLPEYFYLQKLLLEEWRKVKGKESTYLEWIEENLDFLTNHTYFTTYGQIVLQKGKDWNIEKHKQLLAEQAGSKMEK